LGAEINAGEGIQFSPLYAAASRSLDLTKYLISLGAKVNPGDQYSSHWDTTPLYAAAESEKLEIVKYLLEHRAKINY
jgi:ankyrin repeat protein